MGLRRCKLCGLEKWGGGGVSFTYPVMVLDVATSELHNIRSIDGNLLLPDGAVLDRLRDFCAERIPAE